MITDNNRKETVETSQIEAESDPLVAIELQQ